MQKLGNYKFIHLNLDHKAVKQENWKEHEHHFSDNDEELRTSPVKNLIAEMKDKNNNAETCRQEIANIFATFFEELYF